MKKLLIPLSLCILLLAGCTKTEYIEVPEPYEVEKIVYVDKPYEVRVEVPTIEYVYVDNIPEGYVDSYYYCHEDEVYDMVDEILQVWAESFTEADDVIYHEEGYDGYPSIEATKDGESVEADVWDIMMDYCMFEPYNQEVA